MSPLNATDINPGLPAFEKYGRQINPSEDPTKTKGLRKRFSAEVARRWKPSKQYVRDQVITNDFFRLRDESNRLSPDVQALDRFMAGLNQVQQESILELRVGISPWVIPFVREAFLKGVIRANRDLKALESGQRRQTRRTSTGNALRLITNQEIFEAPTLDPDNVQDAIQAGERARLFELQVTTTWQGITGVTAQVNAQVGQIIASGLAARVTPRQLAKDINDRIEKIGVTRSQMIAATEAVAANNRGAVAEFEEAERLTGFDVLVQWETSLDSRVRDTHMVRHGKVYKRDEYLTLISEPRCRCAGLPYIPAIEGEVDPASGRASRDITPKGAKGPAKKKRKQLGVPQEPPGGKRKRGQR